MYGNHSPTIKILIILISILPLTFNQCEPFTYPDNPWDDPSIWNCQGCHPTCLNCTGPNEMDCDVCAPTRQKMYGYCVCQENFGDPTSGGQRYCSPCHHSCQYCAGNLQQCTLCNGLKNRSNINAFNLCDCEGGFYDDGINEQCARCDVTCETCTGGSSNECTSCAGGPTRQTDSTSCPCADGYGENSPVSASCALLTCDSNCLTCRFLSTTCTSCDFSLMRTYASATNTCPCNAKFYDSGVALCSSCHVTCKLCTSGSSATDCTDCDSTKNRITDGSGGCKCMDKFFNTGVELCSSCNIKCLTCQTTSTNCLSCHSSRDLDPTSKMCNCADGYGENSPVTESCRLLTCDVSCKTCKGVETFCTSCESTNQRTLNAAAGQCNCNSKFYSTGIAMCQSCDYTCGECSGLPTNCVSCNLLKFRVSDGSGNCDCMPKYFDDGSNELCLACSYKCQTCTNSSQCLTCDATKFRTAPASLCPCMPKYFDSGLSSETCLLCHFSCSTCSGSSLNECVSCNSASHRGLSGVKCLCLDGFYDDGSNELCQPCHSSCATCFGPANNQCNSTLSTPCSSNCLHCIDSTNCTECVTGYHLLDSDRKCYLVCPDGFWENTHLKICQKCPNGCKTCDSDILCFDCIDKFYFDVSVNLCFSCHETCKTCLGSGQDQCLSCYEPLLFKSNKCKNLTCPYGQYVDSVLGCQMCSDLFSNSLTCNKTQAFLCTATYKLKDGQCKVCSEVDGYHITASTNTCSEVCGDGKLFDYQCDDGNQLDGDGCSKNCIIEEGWSCKANSSGLISTCTLESSLSMSLYKLVKTSGKNTVTLYFYLSLPYRLINNFNVNADQISSSDLQWQHYQGQDDLSSVSLTIDYTKNLQGKNLQISYNSTAIRRLLLTTEITFNTALELITFPPVDFYSSNEFAFFEKAKSVIYYLAIVLLAISLFIFPTKTHLHSFTFSFIVAKVWLMFGLGLEQKLDWVNYVLHDIKPFALIGGASMGSCCNKVSTFYEYSSQFVSNSLWVLLAWTGVWVFLALVYFVNRFIQKIPGLIQYSNYFGLTMHLILSFHVFYSSLNSLNNYMIESKIDAFNISLSIAATLLCITLVLLTWYMTYPNYSSSKRSHHEVLQVSFHLESSNSQGENQNQKALNQPKVLEGNNSILLKNNISFIQDQNQVQSHNQINEDTPYQTGDSYLPVTNDKNDKSAGRATPTVSRSKFTPNYITFLQFDYLHLYSRQRKTAKYFLPFTWTVLYIQAALIVFLAPFDKFYFIVVQGSIEVTYLGYILLQRPFESKFTNFRLFLMTLAFLAMEGIIGYYLYMSRSSYYWKNGEVALIYLIAITFLLGIVFSAIEQIAAWKEELWTVIEPCLIYLRLRGVKRVHDVLPRLRTKQNLRTISQTPEQRVSSKTESQEYDAFYMRMIKKQKVNKKYRRQRKMKQNIYNPY